jgi:peptide deformylase
VRHYEKVLRIAVGIGAPQVGYVKIIAVDVLLNMKLIKITILIMINPGCIFFRKIKIPEKAV